MNIHKALLLAFAAIAGSHAVGARAESPTCVGNTEHLMSWPAVNPIWEMCWVKPSESVAVDGSSLELRKVYFKGHLVMRRAHVPMLFAEYRSSTCYRDWKDADAAFLADHAVQNQLGISVDPPEATTSCDRSKAPVQAYGNCPFQLPGYPNATAGCGAGVTVEDGGDHVRLTTQHSAAWYQYTSRWTFYADGRMEPEFGFGNNDGTGNETTHWHHNYWRMEFAIDDSANAVNTLSINGVDQATEFTDLRNATGGPGGGPKTWEVRNATTGNGYRLVPGDDDYLVPANESGRGFHTIDVMGTRQHDGEYADRSDNPLGACGMNQSALVNGESLVDTSIALYYRESVRDSTHDNWPSGCTGAGCQAQDSMVCKKRHPTFVPFGPWATSTPAVPAATVAPGNVEIIAAQESTGSDQFGLTNSGDPGSTLDYTIDTAAASCASPTAVAWLGTSPADGHVASGATAMITAQANTAGMAIGTYTAKLCVHSNDPANATIEVPVSLEVQAPAVPAATVAPGSIDATVFLGATTTDTFDLTNSGDPGSTLAYTIDTAAITCANPSAIDWLDVSPAGGSVVAAATTTVTASIDAAALPLGSHTAFICVHTNDPANALISVPVNVMVELDPSDVIFANAFDLP